MHKNIPVFRYPKIVIGIVVVLLLAIIGILTIGWLASSKIIAVTNQQIVYDQTVQNVEGDTYTITGGAYNIQGVVGGIRSDGSMIGIFGHPTQSNAEELSSNRSLSALNGQPPQVGDSISLQGNVWTTDPKTALGLDYDDVTFPSPLGDMKAWLVKGKQENVWTIGVHGIGADKTEMLRFIKPVHDIGNTMFVINYRNDASNPASPDGRNNLGNTEWADLEAAVKYAQQNGATTINLYGDSLGGSVVQNYLRRSNTAQSINKVILDSPALDWKQILTSKAQSSGYPKFIYYPTAFVLKIRTGISIQDISTKPTDIRNKTLIFHSQDDKNVPQAASKAIANSRPDLIQLVDFGSGGHLRSWNFDQVRYENTVKDFLAN